MYTGLVKERDKLTHNLSRRIVSLRRVVTGAHDEADLGRFGFGGETAREPVPLLRQAWRILRTLGSDDLSEVLGPPVFANASFDPTLYLDELKADTVALSTVADQVGETEHRAEEAYLGKQEKKKFYDRLFGREARGFADVKPGASRTGAAS